MRLYRQTILLLCVLVCTLTQAQSLSPDARISLITCAPGEELYARFGHTALRVCDPTTKTDVVFNYGIFDFNTEHFYWKFMRGETWYELGASSMRWFMWEYEETHRPVYEQVLNLTPAQREQVWQALLTNYEPENRQYLYNFVFDNCATRPYQLIANALGDTILSNYTGYTGRSYRAFIRHYTGRRSWENAGISLLLGAEADRPMTSEQRLFLPEELMLFMEQAHLSDGTPLVSQSNVAHFHIERTPWYASWVMGLALYFLFVFLISAHDRRHRRWSWWLDIAAGIPYVLLLLIVAFLTLFSCHPLVGFGWRLLIFPLTHLCARLVYIVR